MLMQAEELDVRRSYVPQSELTEELFFTYFLFDFFYIFLIFSQHKEGH